jgi:hypothetical protein
MEACARARVVRLFEDGYSRHVGLTGIAFSSKLLVSVMPGAGAFYYPTSCGGQRSRLAFLGDHSEKVAVL